MRRRRFELRWDREMGRWFLLERTGSGYEQLTRAFPGLTQKTAERTSRQVVRGFAPSQLLIYTRKGRIAKGNRAEATYSHDPRRSRG